MRFRSSLALSSAVRVAAAFIAIGFSANAFAQSPKTPAKPAPKGAPAAPAANGAPQAPQSQQAVAVPTPWTKRCVVEPKSKKQVCEIAQALLAETGQFLMSITISEMQDNAKKGLTIVTPIGMLLPPGVRVHIDQHQLPKDIPYSACIAPPNQPAVCIAEMEVDTAFINQLKKSQHIRVQVINGQRRTIDFLFTTKEFAKVYDGAPIDEKAMAAQRQKLQDELQKRAEEARKKLEGQKK